MELSRDEKERLIKQVDEIHVMITGGGSPQNGLLYKSQKNTEFRLFVEKFGWLILAGFAGIPCTVVAAIVINVVGVK